MSGTTTVDAPKVHSGGMPPIQVRDDDFGGGNGSNGHSERPFNNAFIAMVLFLSADLMFFAGLIGAFIVFRFGAEDWPPPGQPRLPIEVTTFSTAVLLASGYFMVRAWQSIKADTWVKIKRFLLTTLFLGTLFLIVQGYEWTRLLGYGLNLSSGVFGGTFYTLIGCHALHVLGAVIWLSMVALGMDVNALKPTAQQSVKIKLIGMYWVMVVILWPVLYTLVYLS